jgi:hypothetical protein
MSSTIIDSPDSGPMVAASPDVDAREHHRLHRAWLVAVAVVAAATLGLTFGWQTTARSSGSSAPATGASEVPASGDAPVASVGAGLLALAWQLTTPSQRDAACAQFTADPGAAWVAYSSAADASAIATRSEFSGFLTVSC